MKQRQDAWSEENDLLLAETVLRHVREGSTQLNAFEEVGDRLNRTSAACGLDGTRLSATNTKKHCSWLKTKEAKNARPWKRPAGEKNAYYTSRLSKQRLNRLQKASLSSRKQPPIQANSSRSPASICLMLMRALKKS